MLTLRDFLSIASVDCTGIHWNKFTNLNNKGTIPLTIPVWFTLHPPIQVRAVAAIVNPLIWGLIEHENTRLFMYIYIYMCVCVIAYIYIIYIHTRKNIIIYKCIYIYIYIYIYMVPSSVPPPPPPPPPWVGSPGSSPNSLLFASYWQHFWGPASYLLGLCSISDYQPRIYYIGTCYLFKRPT